MVLIDRLTSVTGQAGFFNSGVLPASILPKDQVGFLHLRREFGDLLKVGERLEFTPLNLPPNYLSAPPHCHPGGEIAAVMDGEYFDADIEGNKIFSYPRGSIIIYGAFSTHRPLSQSGALLFYSPLNGIIFPSKLQEMQEEDQFVLLKKMADAGAPGVAQDYAFSWMTGGKR